MYRFITILSLFTVSFIRIVEAQSVSGIVYLDSNSNGVFDADEKGIPGICVSNGKDIVQTNKFGKWELNPEPDSILFVIVANGFKVQSNNDKIPQFFRRINKNDVLGNVSINFPLQKLSAVNSFSILVFADTQARGLKEVNYINHDVVEELIGNEAHFGISLGDITADGPELFNSVNQGIAQIGIPWYNIPGNHDNDRDAKNDVEMFKTYRQTYGPETYAFEYGKVVFIPFNNIAFKKNNRNVPGFSENQIIFLKNYLRYVPRDKLVVLLMHAPIISCANRDRIYNLLTDRMFSFSISGHTHEQANLFLSEKEGWKGKENHHHLINATVSGSWWCGINDERGIPHATMNDGVPNGYSVISFEGNRYNVRFKAASRPENYQMNIYLPDDILPGESDTTSVLVNIFAGSEQSKVEMKIQNISDWIPMQQVTTFDPAVLKMHKLSPLLKDTLQNQVLEDIFGYCMDFPGKSNHFWKAKLPAGLKNETFTLVVRTTDIYGQIWKGNRIFRINK